MSEKRIYHGWLEVEKCGEGFKDFFVCLDRYEKGERVHLKTFRNPSEAIDFWDKRVGKPVKLQSTPLGAYRVFTEVEDEKVSEVRKDDVDRRKP